MTNNLIILIPSCLNIPICPDEIIHVSDSLESTVVGPMEVSTTSAEAILTLLRILKCCSLTVFLQRSCLTWTIASLSGFKQCSITHLIFIAECANPSTVNWYLQGDHGLYREPSKHHTVTRSVAVCACKFPFLV